MDTLTSSDIKKLVNMLNRQQIRCNVEPFNKKMSTVTYADVGMVKVYGRLNFVCLTEEFIECFKGKPLRTELFIHVVYCKICHKWIDRCDGDAYYVIHDAAVCRHHLGAKHHWDPDEDCYAKTQRAQIC